MKKIKLKRDVYVPGYGLVKKETPFDVTSYNSRYIYVKLSKGSNIRLARKSDCEIIR